MWEGGQYNGDEKPRLDALRLAMELGADYIDVELKVASSSSSFFLKLEARFKKIYIYILISGLIFVGEGCS